jgi:hypothetical protein
MILAVGCTLPGWDLPSKPESVDTTTPDANLDLSGVLVGAWEEWKEPAGSTGYLYAFYQDGNLLISHKESGEIILKGTFTFEGKDSFKVHWALPQSHIQFPDATWKVVSLQSDMILFSLDSGANITLKRIKNEQPPLTPPAPPASPPTGSQSPSTEPGPPQNPLPYPVAHLSILFTSGTPPAQLSVLHDGDDGKVTVKTSQEPVLILFDSMSDPDIDGSRDTEGQIASRAWLIDGSFVGSGSDGYAVFPYDNNGLLPPVSAGQHRLVLQVTDSNGRVAQAQATFTMEEQDSIPQTPSPTPAPTPPPPTTQPPSVTNLTVVSINEVQLNPPCDDHLASCIESVELYNPTAADVSIGGMKIFTAHGDSATLPDVIILKAKEYYVVQQSNWLNNSDESLLLRDVEGRVIDQSPVISDEHNSASSISWQRCPDGSTNWKLALSSLGKPNAC